MISKIDNFLSSEQIQAIFHLMTSGQLHSRDGKKSAGSEIKFKKNSTVYDDTIDKKLHKLIFNQKNIDIVSNEVTSGEFNNISSAIAIYNVDDFYDWHLDSLSKGDGRSVKISYTIWLNDPSEYAGGELIIRHDYGETVFKESPGRVVFYPHGLLHRVNNVTGGKRIVIIGFMDCLISSPHDRYLLAELNKCLNDLYDVAKTIKDDKLKIQIDDLCLRISFLEMQFIKKVIEN
jgi:PKHD-type hydroxylase